MPDPPVQTETTSGLHTRQRLDQLLSTDEVERELVAELLSTVRPADIADYLERLDFYDALAVFQLLQREVASEVLTEADEHLTAQLVGALAPPALAGLIEEMSADDGVDILDAVKADEPERAQEVVAELEKDTLEAIQPLMEYEEDTAGGLMTLEYVSVAPDATIAGALEALRAQAADADNVSQVYVVDEDRRLYGVISVRELITLDESKTVAEAMLPLENMITVTPDLDQQDVARLMAKYDLVMVPVVDGTSILGVVTFDDVYDAHAEEADEDLRLMAGLGDHDPIDGPIHHRVLARLPWLMITLGGTFITAAVLRAYEATIMEITATMFFVPAVTAMSGNVGLQSSTTFVRAIALGEIVFADIFRLALREMITGAIIGCICGMAVGISAIFLVDAGTDGVRLGAVVGFAMLVAISISAAIGTFVPLLLDHWGKDPALGAGPFITTLNDIVALAIYMIIATALLTTGKPVAG
ncbi:MAG: magnesium transporter [Planctomycetota bacterium]